MKYLSWAAVLAIAIALGIITVLYLTVYPLQMSIYLFLAALLLFVLVSLLLIWFRRTRLVVAIVLCLVLFIAGYSIMTSVVLSRDDPRAIPEITRAKSDPGLGHTAILYFTHGEPETYDPIGWINQFREFDEQKISFIPFLARPLFIFQLRQHYLQVGKSEHRQMHLRMLRSLAEQYRMEGNNDTRFYISFLDDEPRPDAAAIQALNDGASNIILSEVFLTDSNHTAEGKELIEELNIEEYGVNLVDTGPLWDSSTLKSMFVERANANIGTTDKSKVGVLLVGHGQPDEWDVEWATETEQETLFREQILDLLAADGYSGELLSQAWMEFKEPKPAEKVEQFYRLGAEKVLFFSAAISADSIHSQYDVPALVHEAAVPEDFIMTNLGAWNDDALVILAIKEKIDRAAQGVTPD